jgi:prophage antirepressor-like protein
MDKLILAGNNSDENVANNIFDCINQAFEFESKSFRTVVINDDMWFCGKDVAGILGYKDEYDSIKKHVDVEDKKSLKMLYEEDRQIAGLPKTTLTTIYINESGLYSLVMRSKLSIAKQFKHYTTKVLLPSVRKVGREKYLEKCKENAELTERLAKAEKKALNLTSFIENNKAIEKNQIFYIMTTKAYASNNRFEYGGVKNRNDLKNRLHAYNVGRAEGDLMYIAKIFKCTSYKQIEERVNSVLQRFKDKQNSRKEMIHMIYNRLEEVIDFICDHYDCEIDFINERCQQMFRDTLECEPIIPLPLDMDEYMEVIVNKNGYKKTEKIDITGWTDEQINNTMKEIVNLCSKAIYPDYDFNLHKNDIDIKLRWSEISATLRQLYRVDDMILLRKKFKEWYLVEKPQKLQVKGIKFQKQYKTLKIANK